MTSTGWPEGVPEDVWTIQEVQRHQLQGHVGGGGKEGGWEGGREGEGIR